MRALVIAGTHSGCGKTTVTLGLMAALRSKGLEVQGFKVGPDYIDQGLHAMITQRPCRNLDPWMMGERVVKECFFRHASLVDMALVEGVMGIFDGEYGTWKVAELLNIPVILVVDAYGMAETAGSLVEGIRQECEKRGINLLGVVFTKVGSARHLQRLQKGLSVPFLGFIGRHREIEIPSRHLGLYVAEEEPLLPEGLDLLKEQILENFDINGILDSSRIRSRETEMVSLFPKNRPHKTLAVARDKAFCFYYQDNLDALEDLGYECLNFSPLKDSSPPPCEALYLGGGYPELYAEQLALNNSMRKAIREMSLDGITIYAECGGLIYLSKGMIEQGKFFEFVGLFPFSIGMKKKVTLGYREMELTEDHWFMERGKKLRGHEFHYSEIVNIEKSSSLKMIYRVFDQESKFLGHEGYKINNTVATYIHTYFGSFV